LAGARIIEWVADLFERTFFKDAEKNLARDAGKDLEKGWAKEGLSLSPRENAEVNAFLEQARGAELKISGDLTDIKDSVPGADLAGFDRRLKEPDSLKRKVASDLLDNPNASARDLLSQIKDSVRYTYKIPDQAYADGVRQAVSAMKARGYEPVAGSWKNVWSSEGYKGINSAWRDPVTGHVFEVQFHTPASFDAKMQTHGLYEQIRLPSTPPDVARNLQQQQNDIFGQVSVPPGASNIGRP
jgi:hypothetical protein